MMGLQQPPQSSLFYIGINIEKRVRENHPLRKVNTLIDFNFAYDEVKDLYGNNGNVSVPPPIILKLMLLLIFLGLYGFHEAFGEGVVVRIATPRHANLETMAF